jgi:hypothetical protein
MARIARSPSPVLSTMAAAVAAAMACGQAQAYEFATDDPSLSVRWDNTVKYSTIYRLHDPDQTQLNAFAGAPAYRGSPGGDGDRNFKKGIASNRLDLLSEFDVVKDSKYGGRISGAAWYDSVYEGKNDNTSWTHNVSVPADQFTSGTKKSVGSDVSLMDAFVFAKGEIGDMPASVHLGRHTVIYGETLMDGSNGIAAAQGPVDIVKAATVPGAQVKEFLLPTNQISATLQPSSQLSLGAYYQFQWEKSRFFAAGSFLSPNDFVGDGSEAFLGTPGGGVFTRTPDMNPRKGGQWGSQLRFKPEGADVELGLYAANYHDKTPSAGYFNIGPRGPTSYTLVYQEDIRTYGASASTVLGSDNVSIEASVRDNMPITGGAHPGVSDYGYVIAAPAVLGFNNTDKQGYAVGKTGHITLVDIHVFQPNALLKDGGSVATQYDWHEVRSVTKNPLAVDPTATKSASKITIAFSADYFQVMDGLDLSIPIVLSRSLSGRSAVYVGWVENGGSIDLGVNFKYRTVWKGGIDYHHFMGSHGVNIGNGNFDQTAWDRDYVSLNVSTSF